MKRRKAILAGLGVGALLVGLAALLLIPRKSAEATLPPELAFLRDLDPKARRWETERHTLAMRSGRFTSTDWEVHPGFYFDLRRADPKFLRARVEELGKRPGWRIARDFGRPNSVTLSQIDPKNRALFDFHVDYDQPAWSYFLDFRVRGSKLNYLTKIWRYRLFHR